MKRDFDVWMLTDQGDGIQKILQLRENLDFKKTGFYSGIQGAILLMAWGAQAVNQLFEDENIDHISDD